ncbi:Uu.00g111900.m01.CDS01 [Anthostomella pinea]|uniref:Uu.00g111900.m01.CDS01 n=1 Tax=Anthostomella pinea TaxID=933095 RepID=A0AAI8YGJ3_9PEZI|nr:Uu.00g111900.m01.CDS01 [Anthostomella pinea]
MSKAFADESDNESKTPTKKSRLNNIASMILALAELEVQPEKKEPKGYRPTPWCFVVASSSLLTCHAQRDNLLCLRVVDSLGNAAEPTGWRDLAVLRQITIVLMTADRRSLVGPVPLEGWIAPEATKTSRTTCYSLSTLPCSPAQRHHEETKPSLAGISLTAAWWLVLSMSFRQSADTLDRSPTTASCFRSTLVETPGSSSAVHSLLQFIDPKNNAEELDAKYAELTKDNLPELHPLYPLVAIMDTFDVTVTLAVVAAIDVGEVNDVRNYHCPALFNMPLSRALAAGNEVKVTSCELTINSGRQTTAGSGRTNANMNRDDEMG